MTWWLVPFVMGCGFAGFAVVWWSRWAREMRHGRRDDR